MCPIMVFCNKVLDSTVLLSLQIFRAEKEPWAKAARWSCVAKVQWVKQLFWSSCSMPTMLRVNFFKTTIIQYRLSTQ